MAASITALRSIFVAALPANFPVSVGPPPGGDVPAEYAAVAYGGDERSDVVGAGQIPSLGNRTQQSQESFGIWCTIATAGGEQDGAAQLAVTDGYYQTVRAALRANPSLGILPSGSNASVETFEWSIEEGGSVATVFFLVTVSVLVFV